MNVPGPVKAVAKKAGEYLAFAAVFGTIGTYWLNTEVERRMGELAANPGDHPTVVANTTKLNTLEAGQTRIETKVDAFSSKFLEYLERQARENGN
jgi:hypothetical protein